MVDKTFDAVGGIEQFDQVQATVLDRMKELPARKDLPNAFAIAVPVIRDGQAAVELITCCPTDQQTEEMFISMTLATVMEWAMETHQRREEEEEDETA